MRLIPGKTKVKIELFRKVTLSDVAVGLVGLVAVTLCVVSSLPGRWIIAMIVAAIFALMLFRIDEEPMYVFMWHMLRYKAYPRRYSRVFSDKLLSKAGYENAVDEMFNEEDAGKTDNSDIIEEAAKEQAAEAVQAVEEEAVETTEAAEAEYLSEDQSDVYAEDGSYEESYEDSYEDSYGTGVAEDAIEAVSDEAAETVETVEAVAEEAAAEAEEAVSGKKSKKKDKKKGKKTAATAETKTAEAKPAAQTPNTPANTKSTVLDAMKAATEVYKKATDPAEKKKAFNKMIVEENKVLKNRKATEADKNAVWLARAERSAAKRQEKAQKKDENASFKDMADLMPFTGISGNFIEYNGKYFGAVIEIDPVEFRFFSKHRRNNSIEACFGRVLRSMHGDYGANIVKIQRPIIYDDYLDAEYGKLADLKKSFESGLLNEEEYQARVEIQFDRINEVKALCTDYKVIEGFYYLVMFDSDKRRLDTAVKQAIGSLEQGELTVRRLDTKGLALFLKYTNTLDFDESEIDRIEEGNYAAWAMPENVKFSMRRTQINNIVTHNMRVINYPTVVGDAWLAGVMSFPGTKVVVKVIPMDKTKAIRSIDRSLAELRGQYMQTSLDSKIVELQEHIETLSSLLVTLKQDNEAVMSVSIYITAYDVVASKEAKLLTEDVKTMLPSVTDMKKTVRRNWSEAGMKVSGMDFMQIQGFIGGQISAYDPLIKDARGIPTNTIAGMYPWVFAHISDKGGIKLGSADGVPVFINFFRRDSERVNSNMVIVGKSGSGKSYATKSLLSNLASEDAKIFILDPENEYSELAHNLHGKMINVGNATQGRLNPFHIITALDDDEAGDSSTGGSFATHLQFLEEFFRQILPDIDRDALEYLNSLIERLYLNFGITPETDLATLTADDYPIFDDLYDIVLSEFERTNNEYLRQLLRSLVNYISKFAAGGRNANIWNGPSTITTEENFSVFNFQSLLANRNTLIANAQMLLVLKYIDNEIIKNRDYNTKYGLKRKVVVVIDEAHVFIDTKFPVALDFMFQLAKRIRKYNGMQIVITQNIKDFVGSEEIARKSTAIINACQYSFVFGLAPNDMDDLCKLYEKAGGINEQEQEDIIGAKRGQAFTIMSPTSRSSFMIEVPDSMVEMFENRDYVSQYFSGTDGEEYWNDFVVESREIHDRNLSDRKVAERTKKERKSNSSIRSTVTFEEYGFIPPITELQETPAAEDEELEPVSEIFDWEKPLLGMEEQKPSAVERYMAAEEVVDRKEYEMAVGRFGGISFQEISAEEADKMNADRPAAADTGSINLTEEAAPVNSGSINFTEEAAPVNSGSINFTEEVAAPVNSGSINFTEEVAAPVNSGSINFTEAPAAQAPQYAPQAPQHTQQYVPQYTQQYAPQAPQYTQQYAPQYNPAAQDAVSQKYIDESLEKFRESIRQELEKELTEKIKWISIGAGLAAGNSNLAAAAAGSVNAKRSSTVVRERTEEAIGEEEEYTASSLESDDSLSLGYDEEEEERDDFSYDEDEEENISSFDEDEESIDEEEDYSFDDEEEEEDDFSFDEDEASDDEDLSFDEDDDEDLSLDDDEEEDEEEEDSFFDDDEDEEYSDDDSEEYEPAPFLFSELLAEAAEEYADMDIEERMEEMGEEVMEITLEELMAYIKKQRKKK